MNRSATGVAENTATPTRLVTLPFVAVTASMLLFFLYVGMAIVAIPRFVEFELDGGEIGMVLRLRRSPLLRSQCVHL